MELQYLQLYRRYASLDMLLYFSRFSLRFVLQLSIKKFSKFYEFLFSRNLLVAAANRFKVPKTFISLKLHYIYRTADYGLRKSQMPRVSNGNLIVLKWQNIHVISYIKYTAIYISSLLYIQQRRIQKPFQRLSKEVISLEVTIFTKNSILDV